jgi:hypothetical protein
MPSKEYVTETKSSATRIARKVRANGHRATIGHPYVVYQWGRKRSKSKR